MKRLALSLAAAGVFGWVAAADAGTINLNTLVTGSGFGPTPPTGTVTITDIGTDVRFDFSISEGDLGALFFNLIPTFDFADVSISAVSTSPGSPGATLLDNPQAPSNLDFDLGVDFGTGSSPGNVVTSGSFILSVDGLDLSQPSFYETSTNPGGTTVTIAARLQSLGAGGGGSAVIGGNPGPGPNPASEPATLAVLGAALLGLAFARRRSSHTRE